MRLAAILHRSLAETQAAIDSREFTQWQALYNRDGWPDEREDRRAAAILVAVAATRGDVMSFEKAIGLVNPWWRANRVIEEPTMSLGDKIRSMAGVRPAPRGGIACQSSAF